MLRTFWNWLRGHRKITPLEEHMQAEGYKCMRVQIQEGLSDGQVQSLLSASCADAAQRAAADGVTLKSAISQVNGQWVVILSSERS